MSKYIIKHSIEELAHEMLHNFLIDLMLIF
jgi:hypothetical protein